MIKTDKIGGGRPGGAWRQLGISGISSSKRIYSIEMRDGEFDKTASGKIKRS